MDHFWNKPHMGENWFTYPTLYKTMVETFPSGSHFVEVGSWKGMSASYMAVEILNSGKNIKFDCIDTFEGGTDHQQYDVILHKKLYDVFIENIKPVFNVIKPVVLDSKKASTYYPDNSLDFVFIDAEHTYDGCKTDIISWLPKIKPNGILAGHDYTSNWPGVQQAVREIFGNDNFSDPWGCSCWIIKFFNGKMMKFF